MNSAVKLLKGLDYLVDARNFVSEVAGQDGLLGDVIDNNIVDESDEKLMLVNRLFSVVELIDKAILDLSEIRESTLIGQ